MLEVVNVINVLSVDVEPPATLAVTLFAWIYTRPRPSIADELLGSVLKYVASVLDCCGPR